VIQSQLIKIKPTEGFLGSLNFPDEEQNLKKIKPLPLVSSFLLEILRKTFRMELGHIYYNCD
jgi:hypothetical protein